MNDNEKVVIRDPDSDQAIKSAEKNLDPSVVKHSGIANTKQPIIVTEFNQTNNEVVLRARTNALIVLGNDRPGGITSGKGGSGHTACAAIDLIAGHMGRKPIRDINGIVQKSSKNFEADAARVYISQYCDLDEYFNLPKHFVDNGSVKLDIQMSEGKSGVGAKADVVRLVGRENIKIVTTHLAANSLNKAPNKGGIDILAGADDPSEDLLPQPMVKGDNLLEFLRILTNTVINVQSNLSNFVNEQEKINAILMSHSHQYRYGATSAPLQYDEISAASLRIQANFADHISVNLQSEIDKNEYFSLSSKKYINSKFNRVN